MGDLDLNSVLVYIGILLVFILLWRLWIIPVKWALRLVVNTVIGGVVLLLLNTFGAGLGIAIAINPATAFVSGVLGLPGVGLLLLLHFFYL